MNWIHRHPRLYDFLDTLVSFSFSDRVRRKVLGGIGAGSLLEIGIGSGKCLAVLSRPGEAVREALRVSQKVVVLAGVSNG